VIPSETVQAAQRLEISGTLVRMGGEAVPMLQIVCDDGALVEVQNITPRLLAQMPMLLYKRVRLTVEAERQPAPAAEPTLRDDVERIRAVFAELPREHLDAAMDRLRAEREEDPEEDPALAAAPEDADRRFGPITSDPADAERNIRAKEDAERAAYLARWADAPEWARWLAEAADSSAAWGEAKPLEFVDGFFYTQTGRTRAAPTGVLGSVRCEPRPTQEGGQGVGP
jgi:hypothetical protein